MHDLAGPLIGAAEYSTAYIREIIHTDIFKDASHSLKGAGLICFVSFAGQMVQGKHGMGFSAAEIGLQADDGIAAFFGEALDRPAKHLAKAFG